MKNRLYLLLILVTLAAFGQGCKNRQYNKGNAYYYELEFPKAIDAYLKSLEKKEQPFAVIRLADSYRMTNDYAHAEAWYRKVVNLPQCTDIERQRYVKVLFNTENYETAEGFIKEQLKKNPANPKWKQLLSVCDSVKSYYQDSMKYSVSKLGDKINIAGSNFSPMFLENGLAFPSERGKKLFVKASNWNGMPYLDLYYSKLDDNGVWSDPVLMKGKLNGPYHEGPGVYDPTTKTLYFTRSNYIKNKRGKSDQMVNNLKLFTAQKEGEEWNKVKSMPFNSDEFSCGHPALSPDAKTLYFISDMPGGQGGTDIYFVTKTSNGWSQPTNLGPSVNTTEDEMFLYMHSDGTLYFSSNGYTGLGGLDVYFTRKSGNTWSKPQNMKSPVNTAQDDFGFIIDPVTGAGFLSSNRDSKRGVDEIFSFKKNFPVYTLKGTVKDKETKAPLKNVSVLIRNPKSNHSEMAETDGDGKFTFTLLPQSNYELTFSESGYYKTEARTSTVGDKWSKEYTLDIEMEPLKVGKVFVLNNIYYDFDKWDIRPDAAFELDKVVKTLKDNPEINVELSSHTDSRGKDKYNQDLSQKRAESAVNYILSKGIRSERITAKGYGESKLVNQCKDGVTCTEEEHQLNRRTELTVTSLSIGRN